MHLKETTFALGIASDKPLNNAVLERLKGFTAMNHLKKEALRVMATNLPKEEIQGMKKMFQSIDTDNSGTITVDEFRNMLKRWFLLLPFSFEMLSIEKNALIPDSELTNIMNAVDIDGNGVIDYEEFLAATMNLQGKAMIKVGNAFELVRFETLCRMRSN